MFLKSYKLTSIAPVSSTWPSSMALASPLIKSTGWGFTPKSLTYCRWSVYWYPYLQNECSEQVQYDDNWHQPPYNEVELGPAVDTERKNPVTMRGWLLTEVGFPRHSFHSFQTSFTQTVPTLVLLAGNFLGIGNILQQQARSVLKRNFSYKRHNFFGESLTTRIQLRIHLDEKNPSNTYWLTAKV